MYYFLEIIIEIILKLAFINLINQFKFISNLIVILSPILIIAFYKYIYFLILERAIHK